MSANAPLNRPYPSHWTVRGGLAAYLEENGFTKAGYEEPWATVTLSGVRVPIPNPRDRRHAVKLHDLHHVITGFGTDPVGEGEISGWELRGGFRGLGPYVRAIIIGGVFLGLTLAPRRTIRAFRMSKGRNLFALGTCEYEQLLDLTIGELRHQLGIPEAGLADRPRRFHADAPRSVTKPSWARQRTS